MRSSESREARARNGGLHAYGVGEEVVVRLDGVAVLALADVPARARRLPPWTIADVVARMARGGRAGYMLRFRLRGETCICAVSEAAIEGVA